jgi:hypothetical protein
MEIKNKMSTTIITNSKPFHNDPFFVEYYAIYPKDTPTTDVDTFATLRFAFYVIKTEHSIIANGYETFRGGKTEATCDLMLREEKIYWLFYGMRFEDFAEQLQSFMIMKNDPSLEGTDYALLFYVSLQKAGLQETVKGLPLSLLHDIFAPVAEENFKQWKTE